MNRSHHNLWCLVCLRALVLAMQALTAQVDGFQSPFGRSQLPLNGVLIQVPMYLILVPS